MALQKCETEGCNAKVVVGQNTHCSHCRPRPPRGDERRYDTPEKRARQKAARARRKAAAGVAWLA